MKRRFFTFAAAVVLSLKPFLLGFLASSLGLTDSGGFLSAFLRYLIAPQSAAAICLFFLWYDTAKYAAFRPLAILLQALSLATAIACAFAAADDVGRLFVRTDDLMTFVQRSAVIILFDLAGLIAAITARPPLAAVPAERSKES